MRSSLLIRGSRSLIGIQHPSVGGSLKHPPRYTAARRAMADIYSSDHSQYQKVTQQSLRQKSLTVNTPSIRQLSIVGCQAAIPMIGFGFMDNFLMLQAGDMIDMSLGVTFGVSTFAAMALGNAVSDVAGIFTGESVDAAAAKLSLPQHKLSKAQLNLRSARLASAMGGSLGIVVGCVMGMVCLLWMDLEKADKAKKAKELQTIFESVMTEGHDLVQADRATLWMYDRKTNQVWSRVATGMDGIIQVPASTGLVGACVQSGSTVNVQDAYDDPRFNSNVDQRTGYHTNSVLVVPVLNKQGNVMGAIQMINKRCKDDGDEKSQYSTLQDDNDKTYTTFDESDEKLVYMLASHVEAFIRTVLGSNSDGTCHQIANEVP